MKNYFPFNETQCRCGCGGDITDDFRHFLNCVRHAVGCSLRLSSGYRCSTYDKKIGGKGVHPTGMAADVLCSGRLAAKVMKAATIYDAQGIGVSQKGQHNKRFIHLDITEGELRPWVWSY